jgi:hypothetical protein
MAFPRLCNQKSTDKFQTRVHIFSGCKSKTTHRLCCSKFDSCDSSSSGRPLFTCASWGRQRSFLLGCSVNLCF